MKKNRAHERKRKKVFTTGQLNKLVDAVVHPLCESDKRFLLLDTFLHAVIERNPPETVRKFFKYNLSDIVKEINEKL